MSEWPEVTLGELCHIARGGSPRPIKSFLTDSADGINWIKIGDATAGDGKYISSTREKIKPEGLKMSRLVEPGDFLLSNSMSFGRPYIMRTTGCIHDGWLVLRNRTHRFDPDYLYYFLGSDLAYRQFDALAAGSTVRNLNTDLVKTVKVVLPPLDEQRRIVAVLDEAFAAIATATAIAEKNLANVQRVLDGWLRNATEPSPEGEWPSVQLGILTTKIGSGATPRGGKDFYLSEGIPLIRSLNIHDRRFKPDQLAFLDDLQAKQLSNVTLQGQDVLLNITGASVARCCLLPDDLAGGRVNQHVSIIRTKHDVLVPKFLELLLTSPSYKDRLLGVGNQGGATRQAITKAEIEGFEIALPPIETQREIVEQFKSVESDNLAAKKTFSRKAELLAALKQSLLHRAFTGKLTAAVATAAARNDNLATPEFAAKIVAFAYERHVAKNRVRNFGTVKAEKILHMVEAIGGIDLGRRPSREAAGPDDAKHRHATWDWARSKHFFRFNKRSGGGYDFEKLSSYSRMIEDARTAIAGSAVEKAIELLVDMDRDFAELIATTYAAWNNLIIDQCAATDGDIVLAARDKWHRDKLRFDPSRFHDAIRFIRNNSIAPDGTAKRVGGQEALLF